MTGPSDVIIDVDAEPTREMSPALPVTIDAELPGQMSPAFPAPRDGDLITPSIATAPIQPAPIEAPAKSYMDAGIQVGLEKLFVDTAIQASGDSEMTMAMPVAVDRVHMPASLPSSLPSSANPAAAPAVSSSPIPSVNLLPPTPSTSQDAATSGATALLGVPVSSLNSSAPFEPRSRSSTCSPVSEVRRSPRLASPAPGNKRPASESLDDRASKKSKE